MVTPTCSASSAPSSASRASSTPALTPTRRNRSGAITSAALRRITRCASMAADQAEPAGPFGWRERPRTTVRAWQSTSEFDVVDAEHTAFVAQGIPVVHRRRVVFVKPHCWIVVDDLLGDGSHSARTGRFSLRRCPCRWRRPAARRERTCRVARRCGCCRSRRPPFGRPFTPARWRRSVGGCRQTMASRVPAPMLVYSATGPLPMRQLTVLVRNAAERIAAGN